MQRSEQQQHTGFGPGACVAARGPDDRAKATQGVAAFIALVIEWACTRNSFRVSSINRAALTATTPWGILS